MKSLGHPRISVIVPTYNKARYLERSLASWTLQNSQDYELILLDDGSTDSTVEVARRYEAALPLHYERTANGGRAAARNRALALARGDIVVFCDDDRIVHPHFVRAYADAFVGTAETQVVIGWQEGVLTHFRPRDAALPGAVLALAGIRAGLAEELGEGLEVETFSATDIERDFDVTKPFVTPEPWWQRWVLPMACELGDDITASPLAWIFGTTGNMGVQRSAVERAGGFDERFRGWGLEDAELSYRLTRQGARVRLCRAAVNYHQNHPRESLKLWESWVSNAQLLFTKHEAVEVALYIKSSLVPGFSIHDAHRVASEARAIEGSFLHDAFVAELYAGVHGLLRLAFSQRERGTFTNPRV